MTHVQLPGGVGQHGTDVILRLFFAVFVERVLFGTVNLILHPAGLDFGFDFLWRIGVAHGRLAFS